MASFDGVDIEYLPTTIRKNVTSLLLANNKNCGTKNYEVEEIFDRVTIGDSHDVNVLQRPYRVELKN